MNLKALREKVKNSLDYSPDLQGFNDQLDQLINDAYMNIWGMKRWNFAQKKAYFPFHPDMMGSRDGANTALVTNAAVTKGSRKVTFSQSMDRLIAEVWEGAIFQADGWEYKISKITGPAELLLEEVYHSASNTDVTDWLIKKRYYQLPQDCLELLSLAHTDHPAHAGSNVASGAFPPYGKLIALTARRSEDLNLREDYKAAYAEAYVWSPPENIPPGEKCSLSTSAIEGNAGFLQNTYIEVCWCFEKDGKFGPLSEPATVKFTGNSSSFSLTISFVSWDDQPIIADAWQSFDTQPTQYEGMRKVIFWNANFNRTTGERLGIPAWKTFNQDGATRNTSTYLATIKVADTSSSTTVSTFASIDPGNPRYIEIDGQHLMIRPYPRVDAWDQAITQQAATVDFTKVFQNYLRYGLMRYMYKPKVLAEATDSPEMPYEFHQLIVYKALEEIYLKLGNMPMSDTYRKRIAEEVKGLQKRYLDHIDSNIVRGRFPISDGGFNANYDYSSLRRLS
jgi:hypothetical protein